MASRRGATALCGIVAIDKPAGWTSHDVVARIRRATGEGRVGHAGTLDPMATGLLVVLIGPYTRLEPYLSSASKAYEATISFGRETDTDDAEGETTVTAEVPDDVLAPASARAILARFVGPSMQTPPAYSAIKVGGRISHRVARSGGDVELAARPIDVEDGELLAVDAGAKSWRVSFRVSKGTYIRALARDIGRAAGSAANLSSLRRTASGRLTLADAHTLDEVTDAASCGRLRDILLDPLDALGLPAVSVGESDIADGRALPRSLADAPDGAPLAVLVDGRLAAIYRAEPGRLAAAAVFERARA